MRNCIKQQCEAVGRHNNPHMWRFWPWRHATADRRNTHSCTATHYCYLNIIHVLNHANTENEKYVIRYWMFYVCTSLFCLFIVKRYSNISAYNVLVTNCYKHILVYRYYKEWIRFWFWIVIKIAHVFNQYVWSCNNTSQF